MGASKDLEFPGRRWPCPCSYEPRVEAQDRQCRSGPVRDPGVKDDGSSRGLGPAGTLAARPAVMAVGAWLTTGRRAPDETS